MRLAEGRQEQDNKKMKIHRSIHRACKIMVKHNKIALQKKEHVHTIEKRTTQGGEVETTEVGGEITQKK